MKKAIIFGTDQFAEILYEYLLKEGQVEIIAFTINREYKIKETFKDLPVICFEEIETHYPPDIYGIYICLGYTKMNFFRAEKFAQAKKKGYTILNYTHPSALVLSEDLGEGNIIMEGVTIGIGCSIGNGNVFWARAHLAHHTQVGDFNFFTISVAIAGNIIIQNNCFFGNNCTVKNGLKIASYTLVGAGCYLSENTQEYSVYVPARSCRLDNKKSIDFKLNSSRR